MQQLNDPWHPITDAVDLKHLGKLAEECGELTAIIARCIIQGVDAAQPNTGKLNRTALEDELADVTANMILVSRRFALNSPRMEARTLAKYDRLKAWHDQA